ncbi:hypothetical protein AAMO2058_001341100 [Amorphochlora amoebiformis]
MSSDSRINAAKIKPSPRPEQKATETKLSHIITIGGRRFRQFNPNVVALSSEVIRTNDSEFRFWVRFIIRKGRQITSLLSLGTFMCFLAAYFGLVDTKPGKQWTLFVWTVFCLGIIAECSIFSLTGCVIPREAHVNKCILGN